MDIKFKFQSAQNASRANDELGRHFSGNGYEFSYSDIHIILHDRCHNKEKAAMIIRSFGGEIQY